MLSRRDKNRTLASRAKHYVTLQSKSNASDGQGGQVVTWVNVSENIPVEISPINEVRKAELASYNVIATHEIRVRAKVTTDEIGRVFLPAESGSSDRFFYVHSIADIQDRGVVKVITAEERRP
jgi:hypothetical protein